MGGQSGGGQSTPYEAPNTLSSAQSLRIIDVIAEGVVSGFANGDDAPFKSVHFDDTPVQNPDGSFNFKGVVGFFQRGTPDQDYIPGFDTSERTVAVSARVKKDTPIVRTVSDGLISRLRITVGVERNAQTRDNGDTVAANTSMLVELVGAKGVAAARTVAFTEKGSGAYYQDVVMDKLPPVPFNVRVSRISADSTSDRISNNTFFASYVEIVDAKLSYPHCAVAALAIDSDQFGSSVPRRNYLLKGRLLKVPSNYNPDTRTYAPGAWDGSFKTAWSNNPAWVFYDIVTTARYSTLARRLKVADIDKWSLYQIGRYCDEMVSDGYGGQEPRFVCNAYVANRRQAGEVLLDLASVYTGLPVWNGNQLSVVMDADSDPVALYNNSNVKDGLFAYAGAAFKAIHTAVEVQYLDKHDGYRSKIEPVQDDAAIKRYGLNPKRVVAFGCDSRGQAVRVGAWVLQTELRQQNTISFTVGREGLRHLPYDIVQVMDNQYAAAELSGRVVAADGNLITLDRDVADAAGAVLHFVVDGAPQSAKVIAVAANNQLRVQEGKGIEAGAVWVLSGKVKSRLYRAIGIKENTDEGTYTITALLHDPKKYAVVDGWASFDKETTTLHTLQPQLTGGGVAVENGAVVITWDNLTASGDVLTYDIKIYKDGKLYSHTPDAKSAEYRAENLPNGSYRVEIRGRNARGVLSEPLLQAFTLNYALKNLKAAPKLFAVDLSWGVPEKMLRRAATEIWYAASRDLAKAKKLDAVAWPQTGYTLNGVAVTDRYWFWVRLVDSDGLAGEFIGPVEGKSDSNPAPIIEQVQDVIFNTDLAREQIGAIVADSVVKVDIETETLNAAVKEAENRLGVAISASEKALRELVAAAEADLAEGVQNMHTAISNMDSALKNYTDSAVAIVAAQAKEQGGKIAALESSSADAARKISSVTVAANKALTGLAEEAAARIAADKAETESRRSQVAALDGRVAAVDEKITTTATQVKTEAAKTTALQTRMGAAESGIANTDKAVSALDKSTAERFSGVAAQYAPKTDIAAVRGEIKSAETTLAEADKALARRVGAVESSAAGNAGKISRLEETQATDKAAAASSIEQLQATLNAQAKGLTVLGADGLDRWSGYNPSYVRISDGLLVVGEQSATGSQGWVALGRDLLPLLAGMAYKITYRMRQTHNPDLAEYYVGYAGVAADRATPVNRSGAARYSHQFYAPLPSVSLPLGEWVEVVMYALHPADADKAANYTNVRVAHENVRFIRPIGYFNYNGKPGVVEIDYVKFEAVDLAAATVVAELTEFKRVQAEADRVQTEELREAKSALAGNSAAIKDLQTTSAGKDEVAAIARNALQAEWQGDAQRRVDGAVVATNARIASVEQAAATEKTAQALKNSSMESRIGANAAKVETQAKSFADLNGKISATYMMRVEGSIDGQPVVAGMSLGTDGKVTNAVFSVQNFVVGDLQNGKIVKPFIVRDGNMYVSGDVFADGTILGKHIAADQKITTPLLEAPTINAGRLNSAEINNGNGNFTVDKAGNLYAKNGRFEGVVKADRIEGFLVEALSARRGEIEYGTSGAVSYFKCAYEVKKTDVRAGFLMIDSVEAFIKKRGSNSVITNIFGRFYINGILQRGRAFHGGSLDGVDKNPITVGHACLGVLNFPGFAVTAGEQVFRIELYGWSEFSVSGASITAYVPDVISFILNYQ